MIMVPADGRVQAEATISHGPENRQLDIRKQLDN